MKRDQQTGLGWLRRKRQERIDAGAERLLKRITTVDAERRPPASGARLLAALMVLPVHLVTVGLAVGGGWLVLDGRSTMFRLLGVFAFCMAVVLRPRLGGLGPDVLRIDRKQAPTLFDVLVRIAERTGAPVPNVVVMSTSFNASASRSGPWRRVLEIGAPLWVAAPAQARVALLGHELGHFAHGDIGSGVWVGTARRTLIAGYRFCLPDEVNVLSLPVDLFVLAPIRWVIVGWMYLLERVEASSRRRQELLADLDAAQAGGTDAALELMDVLLSAPTVEAAMTRGALNRTGPPMWDLVREDIAARRDNRTARRHGAGVELSRADSSHPRTILRIQLLESRPRETAGVVVDAGTWAQVDAELADALAVSAKRAADNIRYVR